MDKNKLPLLADQCNSVFTYEKEIVCKGICFELYYDDYGQCYTLVWEDPATHMISQWCCGTYNDYQNDLEDIADCINERRK